MQTKPEVEAVVQMDRALASLMLATNSEETHALNDCARILVEDLVARVAKLQAPRNWVWFGHAGHFCGAPSCQFKLVTLVSEFLVSTVGDYFPKGSGERDTLGGGEKDYYETMVFRAGPRQDDEQCGCSAEPADLTELHVMRYATGRGARDGHMAWCYRMTTSAI